MGQYREGVDVVLLVAFDRTFEVVGCALSVQMKISFAVEHSGAIVAAAVEEEKCGG